MFKIKTFHQDPNTYEVINMPYRSIIEDAWMYETEVGYEVGINFAVKWPMIDYQGGSSSLDEETKMISFISERDGHENVNYQIEWEVPEKFRNKHMACLPQVEKTQCIIHFIEYDHLATKGACLSEYKNPKFELLETFRRFGIE